MMTWFLLAAAAVVALVWLGRKGRRAGGDFRTVAAVIAVLAFVGAAAAGARGAWLLAVPLALAGSSLAVAARKRKAARPSSGGMAAEEARAVLGVGAEAGTEEIQAAYLRLMKRAHPDQGGSTGLAARLNAARDRLLGGS